MKEHHYTINIRWTGNLGKGTETYTGYSRDHKISLPGKSVVINGSADPAFRGDSSKYNPEELFLSSLSVCHMLWYLHFCADNEITVVEYEDKPEGVMVETPGEGGHFTEVTLKPDVKILESDKADLAAELHKRAHESCFIANSVNFEVRCDARILVDSVNSKVS